MSSQRYERISAQDDNDTPDSPQIPAEKDSIPNSPPPSFRSRASSPAQDSLHHSDPPATDAERTLADTFDAPSDDESDNEEENERQRFLGGNVTGAAEAAVATSQQGGGRPRTIERRVTQLPVFTPQPARGAATGRVYGGGSMANDGVFANLSAKPTRGEELEEKPPTYEQAAADATPPYWETTILAPGMSSDDVFVDGLPVGSVFSFVWNGMISMSFQFVGFLLTYLLHTTHAAKNGSRAGLGVTLIQIGFTWKSSSSSGPVEGGPASGGGAGGDQFGAAPPDPNAHDFNPAAVAGDAAAAASSSAAGGLSTSDWLAYGLMIVGWFILIRSVSDFLRARRQEQLVLSSPDRGLGVPVVAAGERPESVV
ncbi:metal homeostatis protein bsd2 [Cryomyces antarcticus]|uniref:Metal homeostatis protein bsd2 n=1 Tax=Cryomyces antarcticus TaxID=329879 RepID=A0ABR0LQG1_9PEZI|nr:hypothetical protein LTR39_000772 [Cryomyces antarcticus]KAK5020356.1 hypothetical protein LTR60_000592 [Cryomyces antarcticus]KAK5201862.1 hypothetical protein LTR16_001203 [Cryomyces antarcticus]